MNSYNKIFKPIIELNSIIYNCRDNLTISLLNEWKKNYIHEVGINYKIDLDHLKHYNYEQSLLDQIKEECAFKNIHLLIPYMNFIEYETPLYYNINTVMTLIMDKENKDEKK